MRLFTAIDLGDVARAAIVAEQDRLVPLVDESRRALRLVRAEHMHLTLVFIGELSDAAAAAVVDVMSPPIRLPPFELVFGGVGVFPERGAPRVLWLGVLEGAREATDVQAHVRKRLADVGIPLESRAFSPHVTLARWKESRGSGRAPRPRLGEPPSLVAQSLVGAVTLYQSRVSSTGSTYTALARLPLT
jgi:2'-5' RNA ligase